MNNCGSFGNAKKLCLQILRESDNLIWKLFIFINDIAARRLSTVQYCLRSRGLLAAKMHAQKRLNCKIVGTYVLTSRWSILLLVVFECLSTVWAMTPPLTATPNCSSVIQIFESYGINKAEVPKSPLSGEGTRPRGLGFLDIARLLPCTFCSATSSRIRQNGIEGIDSLPADFASDWNEMIHSFGMHIQDYMPDECMLCSGGVNLRRSLWESVRAKEP